MTAVATADEIKTKKRAEAAVYKTEQKKKKKAFGANIKAKVVGKETKKPISGSTATTIKPKVNHFVKQPVGKQSFYERFIRS